MEIAKFAGVDDVQQRTGKASWSPAEHARILGDLIHSDRNLLELSVTGSPQSDRVNVAVQSQRGDKVIPAFDPSAYKFVDIGEQSGIVALSRVLN
jgi:hypothetical protein